MLVLSVILAASPSAALDSDRIERIEALGDIFQILLPASMTALTVGLDDWTGTAQLGLTVGSTVGVARVLKVSVDARRPNGGRESFPSGHSASVFSTAFFGQRRYGPAVGLPYFAAAVFTGWSRVISSNHYPRDVAASAAIAGTFALIFTSRIDGRWKLAPWGPGVYGLTVSRTLH